MTRVEVIITEWTWVVSLYYRGVIDYNFACIYFSEDQSVKTLIKCCIVRQFIRIFCDFKKILIYESLDYKGLMPMLLFQDSHRTVS